MSSLTFASIGIWSRVDLRSAHSSSNAVRSTPAAAHPSMVSSPRAAAVAAVSPVSMSSADWIHRGSQLQGNVDTHRAMQRREQERSQVGQPNAASVASAAARVAAQVASSASPSPMLPAAPRSLPSALPLPQHGSFHTPVKLSRRDQLILSTFEWQHRPAPAYKQSQPLTSPQSAPAAAAPAAAAAAAEEYKQDSRSQQQQHRSGSRAATRAQDADRSQLHRSRSTGAASQQQRTGTSFASPLSQRTGEVSSLVGVTPMHPHSAIRNNNSMVAAASAFGFLSDSSDPSVLLSSPHLPMGWPPGPRDAYLDLLAHTKLRMQMEHSSMRPSTRNALTTYRQQHRAPVVESSSGGVSSDISVALTSDLSPLPHSSRAAHRNDRHVTSSSSSDVDADASRFQHSSSGDQSSLLMLTHLSDSPADYNS